MYILIYTRLGVTKVRRCKEKSAAKAFLTYLQADDNVETIITKWQYPSGAVAVKIY